MLMEALFSKLNVYSEHRKKYTFIIILYSDLFIYIKFSTSIGVNRWHVKFGNCNIWCSTLSSWFVSSCCHMVG